MDLSARDRDRLRDRLPRLPPVRWLHPAQLVLVGTQDAQARMFGAFGARRENEAAQPADTYDFSSPDRDVWIDYAADVGDGFDSTYAVAHSIAVGPLPGGETTGHGELLVLGGDEAYRSEERRVGKGCGARGGGVALIRTSDERTDGT